MIKIVEEFKTHIMEDGKSANTHKFTNNLI